MNRKLQMIMLLLGLFAVVAFVGCKDDDEDEPALDALIGQWQATNPNLYGFQEITVFNNQDNSARRFFRDLNNNTDDELGSWAKVQPDSIRYNITTIDGQPDAYQETLKWALTENNNTLTLTFEGISGPVNVQFARQ